MRRFFTRPPLCDGESDVRLVHLSGVVGAYYRQSLAKLWAANLKVALLGDLHICVSSLLAEGVLARDAVLARKLFEWRAGVPKASNCGGYNQRQWALNLFVYYLVFINNYWFFPIYILIN